MTTNVLDNMNEALIALGYTTGSLEDKLSLWATDNGGTGSTLNDKIYTALVSQGATGNNVNDLWMSALFNIGYTQNNFIDRVNAFWLDGGNFFAFFAPLTDSVVPTTGTFSSFARNDADATITDFEGLVKNVQAEEARFKNARRVENVLPSSLPINWDTVSFSNTLIEGITDPFGGTTAIELTATSTTIAHYFFTTATPLLIPAGNNSVGSMWVRSDDVTSANIYLGTNIIISVPVTSMWTRVSELQTVITSTTFGLLDVATNFGVGDTIELAFGQLEDVTGQANQNPSEYVSVGVGTESEEVQQYLDTEANFNNTSNRTSFVAGKWTYSNTNFTQGGGFLSLDKSIKNNNTIRDGALYQTYVTLNITAVDGVTGNLNLKMWHGYDGLAGAYSINDLGVGTHTISFQGRADSFNSRDDDAFFIEFSNSLLGLTLLEFTIEDFSVKEIQHGSNVDGVKYFDYENGNTVASNVVTEAQGTAIADSILEGVLIEEQSENGVYPSSDNGTWNITRTTRGGTYHHGNVILQEYIEDSTASSTHLCQVTNGHTYQIGVPTTESVIVKRNVGVRDFHLRGASIAYGSIVGAKYHLDDGTVELGTYTDPDDAGIDDLGNGVYRCWWVATPTANTTAKSVLNFADKVADNIIYSGDGASSLFIGGYQIEELPYPTSYIPTAGSTVIRSKDVLQYEPPTILTGSAVNDFVITGEITMPFDGANFTSKRTIFGIAVNVVAEGFFITIDVDGTLNVEKRSAYATFPAISDSPLTKGNTYKFAGRFGANGVHLFLNGIEQTINNSLVDDIDMSPSDRTNVFIGSNVSSAGYPNIPIKNLKVHKGDLSDAKCVELTS